MPCLSHRKYIYWILFMISKGSAATNHVIKSHFSVLKWFKMVLEMVLGEARGRLRGLQRGLARRWSYEYKIETKTQIGHSIFVLMPHKLLGLLNLYLRLQHLWNNIFLLLQFIRESSPIISQINPRHLEHNVWEKICKI